MNNRIIEDTLKEINQDNHYFYESNRKWQPLTANLESLDLSEFTPLPFLQTLAILNPDGTVNPLLNEAGLFISLVVMNNEIEQYIPRQEILVSTLGLKFLRSMNTKLYMQKGGFNIG